MFAARKLIQNQTNKQTMLPFFRTYCKSPATPVNKAFVILMGGGQLSDNQ